MQSWLINEDSISIHPDVQIIKHPETKRKQNDRALLRIGGRVIFNQNIYPICLANKDLDKNNAIATGYGYLDIKRHLPDNLQKITF